MVVDAKLLHNIRKFSSSNSSISIDGLVVTLLRNCREYQRRNKGTFRKDVEEGMRQLKEREGTTNGVTNGATPPPLPPAKRSLPPSSSTTSSSSTTTKTRKLDHTPDNNSPPASSSASNPPSNGLNNMVTSTYNPPTTASTATSTTTSSKPRQKSSSSTRRTPPPTTPSTTLCTRPTTRYSDLGGISSILQTVRELVEYPLLHPEVYQHLGIEPPRGILLHGPPGCGKTELANAMAGSTGVGFIKVSSPEIVQGVSGESEERVRAVFDDAKNNAPCILFWDEVDAIGEKRSGSSRGMEKRIVAQMLTCMDGVGMEDTGGKAVIVIGATNRPDAIDPALRRAGRFDREIPMGVPDEEGRRMIMEKMAGKMKLEGNFDWGVIAGVTAGFVGADLKSLCKEAATGAVNRIFKDVMKVDSEREREEGEGGKPFTEEEMGPLSVGMEDFMEAVKRVQPSAKREGFATVPDVTWEDIGGVEGIREELELSIVEPIKRPDRFKKLGLSMPAGCMLYGPPGCGKTLLAKAIANESGANFISVKGPELLDKYVGESERAVRQVFERARASNPCIVFFDELDSLCPRRGADGGGGGGVSERVVNQLLTELDGLEGRKSVFVVAATNRPELIDPAMLRPGRLDKLLYVPLPTREERGGILEALAKGVELI